MKPKRSHIATILAYKYQSYEKLEKLTLVKSWSLCCQKIGHETKKPRVFDALSLCCCRSITPYLTFDKPSRVLCFPCQPERCPAENSCVRVKESQEGEPDWFGSFRASAGSGTHVIQRIHKAPQSQGDAKAETTSKAQRNDTSDKTSHTQS
jgi:hypothetical protein